MKIIQPDVKKEFGEQALIKRKRARKFEDDKAKRYTMDDISVNRRLFRQKFVPTYCEFIMMLENPFDLHGEQVIFALQRIFNFVFPDDKQLVVEEDPIKFVVRVYLNMCNLSPIVQKADQRFLEHRGKCGEYAYQVVKDFMEQEEHCDELFRRDYVLQALKSKKTPAFIWSNFMSDSYDSVRNS